MPWPPVLPGGRTKIAKTGANIVPNVIGFRLDARPSVTPGLARAGSLPSSRSASASRAPARAAEPPHPLAPCQRTPGFELPWRERGEERYAGDRSAIRLALGDGVETLRVRFRVRSCLSRTGSGES